MERINDIIIPEAPQRIIKTSPDSENVPTPNVRDDVDDIPSPLPETKKTVFDKPVNFDKPKPKPRGPPKRISKNGENPNYEAMSLDEQEDYRSLFKSKFVMLAADNPALDIEYPGDHESLSKIHTLYFEYVREIMARMNADEYKLYLLIIFFAVEFFATRFMKIPASGFTEYQINHFSRYQIYLIEMGEESLSGGPSPYPVWMKIAFLAVIQIITFAFCKYISQFVGGSEDFILSLKQTAEDKLLNRAKDDGMCYEGDDPLPAPRQSDLNVNSLINGVKSMVGESGIDFGQIGNLLTNLTKNSKTEPAKKMPTFN